MEGGRGTPGMCEGFFFLRSPSKIFTLALHDTEYNNKQYLLYLQKYMLTILPVLITTLLTILTIATLPTILTFAMLTILTNKTQNNVI